MTNEKRYKREPRSIAEIQADIRAARGRIDATLKALRDRLSADALLHSALDCWNSRRPDRDGTTRNAGPTLARHLGDNLIPNLMVGAGLAWIVMGAAARDQSKTKSVAELGPPETTGTRPSDDASKRRGISPEGKQLSAMTDRGEEKMYPAAQTISDRSSTWRLVNSRDQYPLALGIGFAALGALIGAILPRSAHEDELSRTESDQVAELRKAQGQELLRSDKVASDDLAQSASQQTPQDLTPKAAMKTNSEVSGKAGGEARKAKEGPARAAGAKKRTASKRKAPSQLPIPSAQKKSDENG
jgi:Protein of unknown function (DUF3618)